MQFKNVENQSIRFFKLICNRTIVNKNSNCTQQQQYQRLTNLNVVVERRDCDYIEKKQRDIFTIEIIRKKMRKKNEKQTKKLFILLRV